MPCLIASRQERDFTAFPVLMQCLIHYRHIPVFAVSLYFFFRSSRETFIWYGLDLELRLFSGADYLVFVLWCAFNALKWWRSLWKLVCTNRSNSLVWPSCRVFDFPMFLHSFILPSLVQGVYPILPPSSLFVLIMSMEAHTACPQRDRWRDTQTNQKEQVYV